MKRFVAQFDTSVNSLEDILETLKLEKIEIEKYLQNIDVYVLRSKKDISKNKYLRNVYEIDMIFGINEEE